MASYAALTSLAETIDHVLNHLPHHNTLLPLFKHQLISIHEYVTFLHLVLENFPQKVTSIEGRIRDSANGVEDIIDRFLWRHSAFAEQLLHSELERAVEELGSLSEVAMRMKSSDSGVNNNNVVQFNDASPSTSSVAAPAVSQDVMVGAQDDLLSIKERLCGESNNLEIIPITGMGGIGKTTIARNLYNDPLIKEHFDICAWVTVSQDYEEVVLSLQQSLKASSEEDVYKSLVRRRYLIVLDDIWSPQAWDEVQRLLPDDNNGSRVMLTTRLLDVAAYPRCSASPHEMHFMGKDQSWELLRHRVFATTGEDCPHELEDIGCTIARSCKGLPLAIILLAGVLSEIPRTVDSWESVAGHVSQLVTENMEQFANVVLSLSYNHLPHHLRQCFLYMGAFPEDHVIGVSKLIKLWVAEGFMGPSGSKTSQEEKAHDNLEDLAKRNLVFVVKRKTDGKIKSCSIHDLVRDLCLRKADEEKFLHKLSQNLEVQDPLLDLSPRKLEDRHRRLSILRYNFDVDRVNIGLSVRSIICFQCSGRKLSIPRKLRLLRALDLVNNVSLGLHKEFLVLPDQVYEFFHLRYLAFDYPINIPPLISNLQNLQTLIVHPRHGVERYGPCMVYLPSEIWRLPRLRHLVAFVFAVLPDPPEETPSCLDNLLTLTMVRNFILSEKLLTMIPNLKKLGISYHLEDEYVDDYCLRNLAYLHQLKKLKIRIFAGFRFRTKLDPVFPSSLQKLTLSGTRLPWDKTGPVIGSLPNLEVLKLRYHACAGDKWETKEGEFLQLKFLLIDVSDLSEWITESSHFQSLRCVALYRCRNLCRIPEEVGEFPTLEAIWVDKSNARLVESAQAIHEEQQDYGNETLKVHISEDNYGPSL